jgi:hypothetical protein
MAKRVKKQLYILKTKNRILVLDHIPTIDPNEEFGVAQEDGKVVIVTDMASPEEIAFLPVNMALPFTPPKKMIKRLRKEFGMPC